MKLCSYCKFRARLACTFVYCAKFKCVVFEWFHWHSRALSGKSQHEKNARGDRPHIHTGVKPCLPSCVLMDRDETSTCANAVKGGQYPVILSELACLMKNL